MKWPAVILLQLMDIIAIATSMPYITNKYELNQSSSNLFENAVLDRRTGILYVGAKNRLYAFTPNLSNQMEVFTGPKDDNVLCPIKKFACSKEKYPMDSHSKVIVIDEDDDILINCITLFQGICRKHHIQDLTITEPDIPTSIVANNQTATTFAFIAPGPFDNKTGKYMKVLNVGTQYTKVGWKRESIPNFASRRLDDFELAKGGFTIFKTATMLDYNLRELFPIIYIYGFASEGFSYMITVQKNATNSQSYIGKMFRVCQRDKHFYSYAELQLQCTFNGTAYNRPQAAFLSRSGTQLAKTMGIPDNEDVLYVSFSVSKLRSYEPTPNSALCIYPMRTVRSIFTQNIQECFKGNGNTGPQHFFRSSPCRPTPVLKIDDNYCGKHEEVNSPSEGLIPVKSEAATTMKTVVTSLTVDIVKDHTVAFVGTENGHIMKVALEAQTDGKIYEDVPLAVGSSILPSMFIDKLVDAQYLYVLTDRKLIKMKLYECSQYKTCASCIGAKDPYCGWCSLENKCSLRANCADNDQPLRWLAYRGLSCTSITSVTPSQIQRQAKTTKLRLNVTNFPSFAGLRYQCVFSYMPRSIRITTTNTTFISPTNEVMYCETPEMHLLPPIPTGEDHVKMNLTIQIMGRDFVTSNFTYFDCSKHKSCSSCTMSEYKCTWCIQNHVCRHNPQDSCGANALVYGNKSVDGKTPRGPQECPRIEFADGSPDKIVVPSGSRKSISVKALYLHDFMSENIRCFFRLGQGIEVPARVKASDNPNILAVECDEVEFYYNENIPQMNVQFYIYWQTVEKPLDNPEKIQVIMYKCSAMAETCGECISQDSKYQCGWCGDKCTISNDCKIGWRPRSEICKDVSITSIHPTTGPSQGGTKLTILGKNLGKDFEDIDGGIEVANVACNPIREEFKASTKIVCYTGRSSDIKNGLVRVTVGGKEYANAPERFTYVDPVLEKIHPHQGPMSGGTRVTITGQYLDTGTKVNITFGMVKCLVKERQRNSIICVTSRSSGSVTQLINARFDNQDLMPFLEFSYVNDPDILSVAPIRSIVSGGINIMVNGTNLEFVQKARLVVFKEATSGRRKRSVNEYSGECEIPPRKDLNMVCSSPRIPNNTVPVDSVSGVKFSYGLRLDNIYVNRTEQIGEYFTIYPDPIFEEFAGNMEKSYQSKTDNYLTINGRNLNYGFNSSDVVVKIGVGFCNVTSIDKHGNQLNCKPPSSQPASEKSSRYPEIIVQVGRNYSKLVGYLKYEKPELLPLPVIIGLGVGGGIVVLLVIFFFVLWCIKSRENLSMKKKWQIQMDNLEVKVAKECKEAFAELQTDMTELTSDHFGQVAIPFWDYRTYCMRVLFPQDEDSHPVIRDLDVDPSKRENIEHGLKLFSQLIGNRTFLLTFVRTLEANKKFSMRERVNVASLISVALQTRMEYATEILKTLLAELIEKSVEGKNHPKLLLRRTESVAEKMLTNWFTFLLYKFLRECAGEPLFMLYQAIKQQTSKGPVDSITSEARYSLSEDKLIRQQVDYKPMTIYVQDKEQFGPQSHPVKILDCDTISQVKEKILDAIYKNAPFSSRPTKQNVDLVLFAQSPSSEYDQSSCQKMILSTVDNTTKHEGDFKRLNTLAHYQVPDGAYMALMPKQTPSLYDLSSNSEKSNKSFDYKRFGNAKEDYSSVLYSSRSPSLNRTASPQAVNLDIETSSMNGGTKYYHLVKQHDQENTKEGDRGSKMVSEIYLTRLLATKGTLQQFVDDLFERIFSTCHRGTSLPLAIKYMFDFLDDQALLHNVQDQDVVHTWKSNSLPLRFWVNVIKNPNFVFDIYKSNIVDSCLSVVAQNFMDSCSMSEHKLGKDSPSSKLLYAKDIPTYKKWVERYYQDIKMMPAISDQDMTAMMTDESRTHQDEFNVNAALYELYKYVQQYSDDLTAALDDDEFARKNRLNNKLEQVHIAMNGDAFR